MIDFRRLTVSTLAVLALGCPGEAPPPAPKGSEAAPRKDDPQLSHSWTMGVGTSPLASGDLGTVPDTAAQVLMDQGMPGVVHGVATQCKEAGALTGALSVALRFELSDEGRVGAVTGDPAGKAATCMAEAFAKEASKFEKLPAGGALLRIKFHAPQ